jgi:hypothetical protein
VKGRKTLISYRTFISVQNQQLFSVTVFLLITPGLVIMPSFIQLERNYMFREEKEFLNTLRSKLTELRRFL